MRLTRDLLMRLARNTSEQRVRAERSLVCVYLVGSLLQEEPLLGGTTDIDLIFVHSSQPPAGREIVRYNDDVHIDIAHFSMLIFNQTRQLRVHPWLGPFLCENPVLLHDTQHWFEFTQASVCAQFRRPDNVMKRARPLAETARQSWMELQSNCRKAGPQQLMTYLDILEKAANAIATLSGTPLTERRLLLTYPQRAERIGRPGLAAGLVDLILDRPISGDEWVKFLSSSRNAFEAASEQEGRPARLHPSRQAYYLRAAEVMQDDHPPAALWLLLRAWTLALCYLPENKPLLKSWQAACNALDLSGDGFQRRIAALDAYLDGVEETLDDWSDQHGV